MGSETMLTVDELVTRAGTTARQVDRLVELGILRRGQAEAPFEPADLSRVRLAEALDREGISLEDMALAIERGQLSFGWFRGLLPQAIPISNDTVAERARELGLPLSLIERMYSVLGLPTLVTDAHIREDDARQLEQTVAVFEAMGRNEDMFVGAVRAVGEHIRQIAESQFAFFRADVVDRLFSEGSTPREVIKAADPIAERIVPLIAPLLLWLHARHFEAYWVQLFVQLVESTMEDAGFSHPSPRMPQAIAFADLSGFTRLTDQGGDRVAIELATKLGDLVRDTARSFEGHAVKFLGDGAMLHFPGAGHAVGAALALVERASKLDLPPARVGIHAGPMLFRDGDFFGRTVNLAARILDYARPQEVIVSAAVVSASDPSGVGYDSMGPVSLKGVVEPVELFAAKRIG